tara:strand:- start:3368 stop:4528 length:1161 start_codon:yes stop_codon:yes gene_type:complete
MNEKNWSTRAAELGQAAGAALAHPLARWAAGGVVVGLIMGIMILVYWRAPASLEEESSRITFFQIGTGPSDGSYFSWGGKLSAIISRPPGTGRCEPGGPCGVSGVLAVVKSSSGSVANVRSVATHHIQSALVQSVVLEQAATAKGAFRGEKPFKGLRAIANVQRETVYLVAGRTSGINSPADLVGKRLALGIKGSGTEYVALTLLQAYGIARRQVDASYVEPDRAAEMLLRNQLDAFVYVANDPSAFIANLANRGTINIVPISGEKADALLAAHHDLTRVFIADEAYRFVPGFETLAVSVVWVCDVSESAFLVYDLTQALFYSGNRDLLPMRPVEIYGPRRNDKKTDADDRRRLMHGAAINTVVPLHPGAEQFYRQENALGVPTLP